MKLKEAKWQKDFNNYFDVYNAYVFNGYIDDLQPLNLSGDVWTLDNICEYLKMTYANANSEKKKTLIVYDSSESSQNRFKIYDECDLVLKNPVETEEDSVIHYNNYEDDELAVSYRNIYAQHFLDILREEGLESKLIDHKNDGVTLDIARIHYAVTENSDRNILNYRTDNGIDNIFYGIPKKFKMEFIRDTEDIEGGYIFVIKMGSRLLSSSGNNLGDDELMIFRQILSICQTMSDKHKIIILANKNTDLPMWFTDEYTNLKIKNITIDKPLDENKLAYFDEMIEDESFSEEFTEKYYSLNENQQKSLRKKFLAYTNDFSMTMLTQYKKFLEKVPLTDIDKLSFSVTNFRAGVLENPWDKEDTFKKMLSIKEKVSRKIKGQDEALDAIQKVLVNAAVGFGRSNNPDAPRAVLFLAGPTGTGKTEVCKQLAEDIFGSKDRMIRLDMSEYREDESDQKLFGAPPGYVGYEQGGKLTNAIKKEPFSLVLFDEIEKAAPSIMDKFLQILGDGRLTDGKGETVSFTNAIIVMTSNAGVLRPNISANNLQNVRDALGEEAPEMNINMDTVIELEKTESPKEIYAKVKEYFRYNLKYHFIYKLSKPEIYGRIEDAIVYYNYICKDSVEPICKGIIESVEEDIKEKYHVRELRIDNIKAPLYEHCNTKLVREIGARGIVKAVNSIFNSSLSDFVAKFERQDEVNGQKLNKVQLQNAILECTLINFDNKKLVSENFEWRIVND